MICRNCNTEHNGKFCPNCGSPANNETTDSIQAMRQETATPPKTPITKKWWFWAIGAVLVIAMFGNLGEAGDKQKSNSPSNAGEPKIAAAVKDSTDVTPTPNPTDAPTPTQSPEPTIDLSTVALEYTLTAGNYVAGIDIPAGRCTAMAVNGTGNLSSSNMFSGGINEMFGVDEGDGFYTSEFSGLKLPEGTILTVGGNVQVKLMFSVVEASFTGRTYDESNAIELGTGNFESGIDFPAGVYKIVAISGTGNLSSDNMFDGGINEVFGIDNGYNFYIPEFVNVDLPTGTELTVSGGVKIRLIPAIAN